ncbi:MAG: thioredoxin [Armatimonadota bacterium]
MNGPVHVTDHTFESEVLKADLPVLADFWAEWCGPCRMIAPIVEDLAGEYAGRVKVVKVDVDENPHLAIDYQIMSIPTLALFKNGELVDRLIGYMPKSELTRRIYAALGALVTGARSV